LLFFTKSFTMMRRSRKKAAGVAGQVEDTVPLPESGSAQGGGDDDAVVEVIDDDDAQQSASDLVAQEVAAAGSVWTFEKVEQTGEKRAEGGWKCLWCNNHYKGWNATKVLRHLTKVTGRDIRPCKARIDPGALTFYRSYMQSKEDTKAETKQNAVLFQEGVSEGQQSLAVMFEAGRSRTTTVGGKGGTTNTTIEASTASQLTMAIADFVHATGLSFSATQGIYFERILTLARGVPSSYQPPTRNAIGTTLLKLNYARRLKR
jgi:hypothetical protein